MKKTTLFCVLIVMSFGTLRPALADIDIPEEPIKGGYDLSRFEFTIGPTVLKEHGFGVAARILADPIGLEGGFAYMPWFVILMGACEHFDVLFKMHVDGSLLIRLANIKDKMRVLLKLGGGWMDTFGYDIKIGAAFDLYFSEYFLLDFAIGTQIVPGVEDFLEKTGEKECPNTKKQDDYLNFIQPYIGVTAYFRL